MEFSPFIRLRGRAARGYHRQTRGAVEGGGIPLRSRYRCRRAGDRRILIPADVRRN